MINLFFLHTMGRIKENFRVDSVCIRLTLTYFTARSNLVPYAAFVWEIGKTMDFLETIVVYDLKPK